MTIQFLVINAVLALALLFINGLIGKIKMLSRLTNEYATFEFHDEEKNFSDNFFHAIVHPAIYIALVSAILQCFSLGIIARELWLVVPFYWAYRFLHTLIWNRLSLINWRYELLAFAASLLLGGITLFCVVRPLIDKQRNIFIDLEQFRDAFWFAVFAYLFKLLWDIFKKRATSKTLYPGDKKHEIIRRRYCKFRKKYNIFIEDILLMKYNFLSDKHKKHFVCLVYSIMIYEDHCRPCLIRIGEYVMKLLYWKSIYSLGIMQVQTKRMIGNKRSIELAIDKIYGLYAAAKPKEKIYQSITGYNGGDRYYEEVHSIYCFFAGLFGP